MRYLYCLYGICVLCVPMLPRPDLNAWAGAWHFKIKVYQVITKTEITHKVNNTNYVNVDMHNK